MQVEQHPRLLTAREVAEQLRVDSTTVLRWIKAGTLEAVKLPHQHKRTQYRVKQATIDALLAGHEK